MKKTEMLNYLASKTDDWRDVLNIGLPMHSIEGEWSICKPSRKSFIVQFGAMFATGEEMISVRDF